MSPQMTEVRSLRCLPTNRGLIERMEKRRGGCLIAPGALLMRPRQQCQLFWNRYVNLIRHTPLLSSKACNTDKYTVCYPTSCARYPRVLLYCYRKATHCYGKQE